MKAGLRMRKNRAQGLTSGEMRLAIIVVSLLLLVALERFWFYQERAEKAAMEQMAGILRSALQFQLLGRLAKGRLSELQRLAEENPMDWLAEPPPNFSGARFGAGSQEVNKGSWYFDLKSRELVYVVAHSRYFTPGHSGRREVRYKVRLVYANAAPVGRDAADKSVIGATLALVEPYGWF